MHRDKHYLSLGLGSAFEDLWTFVINAHVRISLNFAHPDKHNPPKTLAQPAPRPKTINSDVFKGFAVDCGLTHGDLGEAKRNPILIGIGYKLREFIARQKNKRTSLQYSSDARTWAARLLDCELRVGMYET